MIAIDRRDDHVALKIDRWYWIYSYDLAKMLAFVRKASMSLAKWQLSVGSSWRLDRYSVFFCSSFRSRIFSELLTCHFSVPPIRVFNILSSNICTANPVVGCKSACSGLTTSDPTRYLSPFWSSRSKRCPRIYETKMWASKQWWIRSI